MKSNGLNPLLENSFVKMVSAFLSSEALGKMTRGLEHSLSNPILPPPGFGRNFSSDHSFYRNTRFVPANLVCSSYTVTC